MSTEETKGKTVTAYKAFNQDWTCRGFQYEVGKTYEMPGPVVPCQSGFHACTIPVDVFRYYDLDGDTKIALVEVVDPVAHGEDSKVATAKITIKAELSMPDWIGATVRAIADLCKSALAKDADTASGNSSKQAASGTSSTQAASGDYSKQAASGDYSTQAASGDYSTQAASGDYSKQAASGDYSTQAASGDYSTQAASGDYSTQAASGGSSKQAASGTSSKQAASGTSSTQAASGDSSKQAASGGSSKQAASGDYSTQAASGDYSTQAASGKNAVIVAAGTGGKAKAAEGGAIALAWHDGKRPRIAVGYVGEDGIKADTWYEVRDGKLSEVQS